MAIKWKLKKYLEQKHSIYSPSDFRKNISEKTGVTISLQNICNYLNKKPTMIRLDTMELICIALDCNLVDILEITPPEKYKKIIRKLSYKNTPLAKKCLNDFPSPEDYDS